MSICSDIYAAILQQLEEILALRTARTLKPDGSFVTSADLLCERIISEHLAARGAQLTLISEESYQTDAQLETDGDFIIADPLDGTENFTSGLKEWGVALSVWYGGRHSESLIGLPELGLQLQTGDAIRRWDQSRIYGLSSSLSREDLAALPDGFEYRITGCAVYNLYAAILGHFAGFENVRGAAVWDILAGINLAREHGLRVLLNGAEYAGQFISPHRRYRITIRRF